MGPKNACSYADIVAEYIDKKVLEARTIYPELRSWYRFHDDTFVLWQGTVQRLHAFFDILNLFDSYLQFTMDIGGNVLHFLDLSITIFNNRLETSVYSKPTDAHLYLNARSCHCRPQVLGIPKGVALRLRRICSQEVDFKVKSEEYINYLVQCGHDENNVRSTFQEVSNLTRKETRARKKKCDSNPCVLSVKYNPRAPDIRKIIRKHLVIIENDVVAKEILPAKVVRIAYKRLAPSTFELLAPSNPYNNKIKEDGSGCFRCEAKR